MGKKEVLMVVDSLGNGGVERVVTNIISHIDTERFMVYVYVLYRDQVYCQKQVESCGAIVINTYEDEVQKHRHTSKRIVLYREISRFLKNHPDICAVHVHCANQSPEVLLAAKRRGIRTICIHAHVAFSPYWNPVRTSLKSKVAHRVYQCAYRTLATCRMGCSQMACESIFGAKSSYKVILNGMDFQKFNPDSYEPKSILREKYQLEMKTINFLFVGRFATQKNILFMLEVLSHVAKSYDIHLTVAGYGELEKEAKKKVTELGMDDYVRFVPGDSNIPELMKAHDYFICPSLSEGLGITFLEAQMMGLTAFASDAVPGEADLGRCKFFTLSKGAEHYAKEVMACLESPSCDKLDDQKVNAYQMKEIVKELEKIYGA